jgi:hypothetical protein
MSRQLSVSVDGDDSRAGRLSPEAIVALVVVGAMAIRLRLPLDLPFSVILGVVLLPVTLRYLRQYRWAVLVACLSLAAAIAGVLLAAATWREVAPALVVAQTARVLGVGIVLAAFLWARSLAGTQRTILAFAIGAVLSIGVSGVNDANLWKFTFSAPLVLLLLSLPGVYRRRIPQAVLAFGLAAVSLVFDSRSLAGFLLVATALTLTQRRADTGAASTRSSRAWLAILRFGAIAVGAFLLVQGAILEGMLGDEIRVRTESQIATSGSVLAGGRPEMGASAALIAANPAGFGVGVLATPTDILVAKGGMAALGYDPNNGYVENYMFGLGFEVHSVLADLWILCGPLGAVLAVACAIWLVRGTAQQVAAGTAATVVVYLATRSLWDLAFSPFFTSIAILPLALAVVAERREITRADPLRG